MFHDLLRVFIFIKHFCWLYLRKKDVKQYLQTCLLNEGLSRQSTIKQKYNHLNRAHRGFTPNVVVVGTGRRRTVQAQL